MDTHSQSPFNSSPSPFLPISDTSSSARAITPQQINKMADEGEREDGERGKGYPVEGSRSGVVFLEAPVLCEDKHLGRWQRPREKNDLSISSTLRESPSPLPVLFFDLDNTLYSKETGIAEEMGERIQLFFQEHLHLPYEESRELGHRYYLDYGLAIKGLVRNFQIDPRLYDQFVDGGLQLERVLRPNTRLHAMLQRIKARRWIFTNAGINHTLRVLRLLKIEDCFEGVVYCDYSEPNFPAKPDRLAYDRAMLCAGVANRPDLCYFVDDSANNVRTARELGWQAVHIDERPEVSVGSVEIGVGPKIPTMRCLWELETVFPKLFLQDSKEEHHDRDASEKTRVNPEQGQNVQHEITIVTQLDSGRLTGKHKGIQ